MRLLFNQLADEISRRESFLFVCHRNPDPDTIGSALALGGYIESLGKKADYFCIDKIPYNFSFLKIGYFSKDPTLFLKNYDAVIFIDCAESGRSGIKDVLQYKKQIWISVDHHLLRDQFADLEIRNPEASATAEIIYKFFTHIGAGINMDSATALLAGILIDTDFLSNAAATDESIKMAGELTSLGADYRSVVRAFHMNKNAKLLRLWGIAFSRLKYNKEKGIASTAIFKEDMEECPELDDALSGLSGFLNAILKTDIIMVFDNRSDLVKGSLRTARENINVAKIAEEYGGGGHAKAAGFMCPGKLVERENEWAIEKI
ncbi:MAG: DHH family phosphoesterase [Patescibacteria group bacterium]